MIFKTFIYVILKYLSFTGHLENNRNYYLYFYTIIRYCKRNYYLYTINNNYSYIHHEK